MTQKMREKRDELKALSAPFKILVKEGLIPSINAGLAEHYAESGHTVLKSYREWKNAGYQVQQGSKALLFWATPRPVNPSKENQRSEDEDTFFPVAYLFSNLQVKQLESGAQPVKILANKND